MPPSTRLRLRVTAAPELGRANEAVLDLIASSLDVPRASIELVAGHTAQDKVVELAGIESAEADRRLTVLTEKELR